MVGFGAMAGIAVVAIGLVVTPGPNMIYLVSRAVSQGSRAGPVSLGGIAVGFAVYLLAATAGIVTVFSLVPELYVTIKLAGAAYLLWLAWKTVRPGGVSPFAPRELAADSTRRLFVMGLVTNLLNPKIAILYVSPRPEADVAARPTLRQRDRPGGVRPPHRASLEHRQSCALIRLGRADRSHNLRYLA